MKSAILDQFAQNLLGVDYQLTILVDILSRCVTSARWIIENNSFPLLKTANLVIFKNRIFSIFFYLGKETFSFLHVFCRMSGDLRTRHHLFFRLLLSCFTSLYLFQGFQLVSYSCVLVFMQRDVAVSQEPAPMTTIIGTVVTYSNTKLVSNFGNLYIKI